MTTIRKQFFIPDRLSNFAVFDLLSSQIYYTGKYQSLGIKQGGPSAGKWVELPVTKSPKIVQFSVGHDGSHALLVAEDGSVFFTGSASKGEDGESSKTNFKLSANIQPFILFNLLLSAESKPSQLKS